VSFIRPRWLDDVIRPLPSASPRLRGLKGFDPHHVVALQDPLYADDPIFWVLSGTLIAAVALNSIIGIQTPADDSWVVSVDHVWAQSTSGGFIILDVNEGGAAPLALINDDLVFKRNRRELARTTGAEKTGLRRIQDNSTAFTAPATVAIYRVPAGGSVSELVGHRLFGNEQLFARIGTNADLTVTMVGRLMTKGQR
jgi:hypothetical protein